MSQLVEFRKAVEATFRSKLPMGPDGIREVVTHIGEFGADEVMRYARAAPAVILAPLGMPDIHRAGGTVKVTVNYAAFVLAKGTIGDSRGDVALAVIEEIAKFVPYENWGGLAQAAVDIDAGNLYTGDIDEMGITLWAIRWRTVIQLQTTDVSSLADFLRLDATYNLDPGEDDPDDFDAPQTIELPGPE